jgi:hypothetical protein
MDGFAVRSLVGDIMVEPGDASQAVVRLGLLGNYGRVRTRAQYMRQVSGDDSVSSQTTLSDAAADVRGNQWGKDWFNLGVGGELWSTRHWQVFADYNFDMGRHTTSHLGSLNTIFRW